MTDAVEPSTLQVHIADAIEFYYTCIVEEGVYNCKKCKKDYKQKPKSGYSNLKKHLESCIGPSYLEVLQEHIDKLEVNSDGATSIQDKLQTATLILQYSTKERDTYKWIEWVVLRNQSISEVEDPLTREGMKYGAICKKTLRKYILKLIPIVQLNIKADLDKAKFALAVDGWTHQSTHYVAAFAVFVNVSTNNIRNAL
jgi:hypothetical protein